MALFRHIGASLYMSETRIWKWMKVTSFGSQWYEFASVLYNTCTHNFVAPWLWIHVCFRVHVVPEFASVLRNTYTRVFVGVVVHIFAYMLCLNEVPRSRVVNVFVKTGIVSTYEAMPPKLTKRSGTYLGYSSCISISLLWCEKLFLGGNVARE